MDPEPPHSKVEDKTLRHKPTAFTIGDDVLIVGGRWRGSGGIVVRVSELRVCIVDDAGFRRWNDVSHVIHNNW